MAKIDFPNNPNMGEVYEYAGQKWRWDGKSWNSVSSSNLSNIDISLYQLKDQLQGIVIGDLLPLGDGTINLGSLTKKFKDIHLSDSLVLGGSTLSTDDNGDIILDVLNSGSTVKLVKQTDVAGLEQDPIVGSVDGLVKSDGLGNIERAIPGTDYLVTETITSLGLNSDLDSLLYTDEIGVVTEIPISSLMDKYVDSAEYDDQTGFVTFKRNDEHLFYLDLNKIQSVVGVNEQPAENKSSLVYNDSEGKLVFTPVDLSSVDLQTVLDNGSTSTTSAVIPFYYDSAGEFPSASNYHGAIGHSHADGAMYFAHGGDWNKLANYTDVENISLTPGADGLSAYEIAGGDNAYDSAGEWLESLKGVDGINGTNGNDGQDGQSAYEIAVQNNFQGDEPTWLASLQGADGAPGADGQSFEIETVFNSEAELLAGSVSDGKFGIVAGTLDPTNEDYGKLYLYSESSTPSWSYITDMSVQGADGITGPKGDPGDTGATGAPGADGLSAYEIAGGDDTHGSEAAWLESLNGTDGQDGQDGQSAYEIAGGDNAYDSAGEWLASLQGADGTATNGYVTLESSDGNLKISGFGEESTTLTSGAGNNYEFSGGYLEIHSLPANFIPKRLEIMFSGTDLSSNKINIVYKHSDFLQNNFISSQQISSSDANEYNSFFAPKSTHLFKKAETGNPILDYSTMGGSDNLILSGGVPIISEYWSQQLELSSRTSSDYPTDWSIYAEDPNGDGSLLVNYRARGTFTVNIGSGATDYYKIILEF